MNRRHFVLGAASAAAARRAAGANDRIGVAIIGCGVRGFQAHLRAALEFGPESNVEVTAVCDTWRQQREQAVAAVRAAGRPSPEAFVHYQDVLAAKSVDAVVIATPDHQHCTQLVAAINARKDVYVEKPLAMDMKELLEAVDAVNKSDRIVQCGSQMRSAASAAAAKAFVASGGLGKILKIEQSRNDYRPYWHGLQGEGTVAEADVDWRAFLMHRKYRPWDPGQYIGWYGHREFSRGPHAGFMSHFTDLLHFVTGAQYPWRAVALGGIYCWKDAYTAPDSIEVVLEYREGFLVRYNTTFGTSANRFMRFIGTRGVMDAQDWYKPWVLAGERAAPDRIPAGAMLPPAESTHHMKNWFDCLRSRKQPIAPIDAGFGHAVACIMADEAFIRGRRMVFDPVKRAIREG